MKKKYIIILVGLSIMCAILPFLVEWLYDIGETIPIIKTHYDASDVLGYIASVIGLIISTIALFYSLHTNDVDISIKHAHTISEKDNDAICIELSNNSTFDCHVMSVELCNLKDRIFCHIASTPPFSIQGKANVNFIVEVGQIQKVLSSVKKKRKEKDIKYCIRLSIGKNIYLKADELFKYLST